MSVLFSSWCRNFCGVHVLVYTTRPEIGGVRTPWISMEHSYWPNHPVP